MENELLVLMCGKLVFNKITWIKIFRCILYPCCCLKGGNEISIAFVMCDYFINTVSDSAPPLPVALLNTKNKQERKRSKGTIAMSCFISV